MAALTFSVAGSRFAVDAARAHDLSIPLRFDGPQPAFFGAPAAHAEALRAGSFHGAVARGGSCNCSTYTLTPHCNGTHTECVGHVTAETVSVRDVAPVSLLLARLITLQPRAGGAVAEGALQADDLVIARRSLEELPPADMRGCEALIVRTVPNSALKEQASYGQDSAAPYFTAAAMQWIVEHGIQHLVVDLPSVDKADDGGRLLAHRTFWGLPAGSTAKAQAARAGATITELAYIEDAVPDGLFLLNLQVAPFEADAAPSRPLLYPLAALG